MNFNFKNKNSVDYEEITYEEAFNRVFETIEKNKEMIEKQNDIIEKQDMFISYLEKKIEKHNEIIVKLDSNFNFLDNRVMYLDSYLKNIEEKQEKIDLNETNIISNLTNKIQNLDDKIQQIQKKKNLTFYEINTNKYIELITFLNNSLINENIIFLDIQKTRTLPIITPPLYVNENYRVKCIWYFINHFTNADILKKYVSCEFIINYNFDITNLFTDKKQKNKYSNLKRNSVDVRDNMMYYNNNTTIKSNEPYLLFDFKQSNRGCSAKLYSLNYEDVYTSALINLDNYILKNIKYESEFKILYDLIMESYERLECLKKIRDNKYDINMS